MEDNLLLIKKAQQGDKVARNQIVEQNVGLVWSIVKRFNGRGHETDDLYQIGCIGLIKSVDKFNFNFGVKFSTYAVPMIIGEIKRFLRDDGMIKVSRTLKETANKVFMAREKLSKVLGREPTLQEISASIDIEVGEIILALDAKSDIESLYKSVHQGDGNSIFLIDKIKQKDVSAGSIDLMLTLKQYIKTLEEKEQKIIELRYFMDKTQSEIASAIGISQVQVSRIEKKVLGKMKKMLSE